ncbi:MAG: acetyl-CoA acetyltransferase [Candidatus Hydrothermales bacterium]
MNVYIVGMGISLPKKSSSEFSFREMIYEAAIKAYKDANIEPKNVDIFVSVSEDFEEGTSIFDEYVPDQLGAVLKPVHTICADALTGLVSIYSLIKTGHFKIGVLEAHSKLSNVKNHSHLFAMGLDPVYIRPLEVNPYFIAGLEMAMFLDSRGYDELDAAFVVSKNKSNALTFGRSPFGTTITPEEVLFSEPVSEPLKRLDISPNADGACVFVIANEEVAKERKKDLIRILGLGFGGFTPNIEMWRGDAEYLEVASKKAYSMAGIKNPIKEIDFAEIDDTFSYKELQHIEALSLSRVGESAELLKEGFYDLDGELPVNTTGGNMGNGNLSLMNGARSLYDAVLQLRGHAGNVQLLDPETALVASWKGLPSASGAVVILKREG